MQIGRGIEMRLPAIVFFCAMLICVSGNIYADEAAIMEKIKELEAKVDMLEKKLSAQEECMKGQELCINDQQKKITEYEERFKQVDEKLHRQEGSTAFSADGLRISAGATMIVQGTDNTNATEEKKRGKADASFSEDITISKEFEGLDSEAFIHLEAGQGAGLTDDLSLFSNVNADADDDEHVVVSEIWYEQGLFNDKALITFGKLDPTVYFDTNEVANDETTQFLSYIFRSNPAVEFPDNTFAIRAAAMPASWLELNYGVFDGDSDWDNIGDNLFNIGQVTFKAEFFGLPGNYRFLGWSNNSRHTKWLDPAEEKEDSCGFGLSFDQKVHDMVTLFARYGWQDPKVYNPDLTAAGDLNYSLEHSWSAGLQVEGKPWNRENDVLGIAVGQAIPSDDYKKAGELKAKNEGHFEAYYRIRINDHLSISPDFQYIWDPFGKDIADDTDDIFVYGLRTQVDF